MLRKPARWRFVHAGYLAPCAASINPRRLRARAPNYRVKPSHPLSQKPFTSHFQSYKTASNRCLDTFVGVTEAFQLDLACRPARGAIGSRSRRRK